MTRKTNSEIKILGVWDKNIPLFMDKLHPQKKYDYFTCMKHNISNPKILGVIFHRICGDYESNVQSQFTEKFKLLKKWLFLSDRTDKLPSGAYLAMWKAWKLYQEVGYGKILASEYYYKASLDELYPESEYMFVSSKAVTEPIYYLYKPNKIEAQNESIDENQMDIEDEYDQYGGYIMPEIQTVADSYIQTSKMFEYLNRNFMVIPCDYCRRNLSPDTLCISLSCNHFVHKTCCQDYQCLKCEDEKLYRFLMSTTTTSDDVSENGDNIL